MKYSSLRFAVAGQAFLPGTLAPVTVRHLQRELSQYIWHAIERNDICGATVLDPTPRPSSLVQARKFPWYKVGSRYFRIACEIERCSKPEETSRTNPCCGLQ